MKLLLAILFVSLSAAAAGHIAVAHGQEDNQEDKRGAVPDPLSISREERLKVFEKLCEIVDREYFDSRFSNVDWAGVKQRYRPKVEAVVNKPALRQVLQEMLDELHTSHLSVWYHAKIDKDRLKEDIEQKISRKDNFSFDPGLRLKLIEGRWVVDSIMENSGAQLAGIERGWTLTHWNDVPYPVHSGDDVDIGDVVTLRFIDLKEQQRSIQVKCKLYLAPKLPPQRASRVLAGGVIYLRIDEFFSGTDGWLSEQVSRNHGAPAIIIDLRGNPGGITAVMRKSLEPFFSEPAILGEFRERTGKEPALKTSGEGKKAFSGKVIVLIDEMSGSSAEMFAAAIQESGRGSVIGRQSSGSVFAAHYHSLPDGFKAEVPFRDYKTAKGIRLEGRGVIPDRTVRYTLKDFLENRDRDLAAAMDLITAGQER